MHRGVCQDLVLHVQQSVGRDRQFLDGSARLLLQAFRLRRGLFDRDLVFRSGPWTRSCHRNPAITCPGDDFFARRCGDGARAPANRERLPSERFRVRQHGAGFLVKSPT